MKILILGSNGLVGSSLTRLLNSNNKYEVFPATRRDADLFSFEETSDLVAKFNPDILINSAAKVGGIHANNSQRTNFILENLKININVLEACINFPNIFIINLGSSCIYPLEAKNPIVEDSIMTGMLEPTNSPYAMAKLTAIELANSLNLEYGHEILNLMPTNLYGPGDNFSELESHVIPGLIYRMHEAKINNEESFRIWGTGKPLREFLHVDDLASAIDFLINNRPNESLLNIGSGFEISIFDLAQKIKEVIDYKGNLIFDDSMPDGNPRKLLDSTKLFNLGWKPKLTLDEGLIDTYKWFLANY
tara:strand:+ start:1755 stop:2669 length:915 start_codon:yes stop_codon:yes gene_type:complete